MPKRKGLVKVIEGTGNNELKALVQKARPLQSLSETELTLPEFKILDVYLGRINSHDKEKRTVVLEKGELERALGVSRILKEDLEQRLRHLFQVVKVKDDSKKKGFKLINLFEEADAEQDDDGIWTIQLTCTASAREYIFNIDNIGYLRYRLKNVIDLTSRYSYILYLYLLDNRFKKSWEIPLDELKELLNCTADRYKDEFKFFNSDILKDKCYKEINSKTDLKYSYEPVKKGRKVVAIKFTIETENEQLSLLESNIDYDIEQKDDTISLLSSVTFDEFTENEYRALWSAVCKTVPNDEERFDFFISKWNRFSVYADRKKIKDRFNYFLAVLSTPDRKKSNSEEQASYDLDEFERSALITTPKGVKNSD